MKKTIAMGLVILGACGMRASAGEFGLLLDKQIGTSQAVLAAANAPGSNGSGGSYDSVSPTGVGFRAAYTVVDLHVAELGLAVTYHPKTQGNLIFKGANVGQYSTEYVAVGIQADWKFLLNFHAGVDMRSEKLTTTVTGAEASTTYTRPWAKAGVGFSVPTPLVSPFVRLEVAVPITKDSSATSPDDFRKAMAPSLQVSLYGGIRF